MAELAKWITDLIALRDADQQRHSDNLWREEHVNVEVENCVGGYPILDSPIVYGALEASQPWSIPYGGHGGGGAGYTWSSTEYRVGLARPNVEPPPSEPPKATPPTPVRTRRAIRLGGSLLDP